MVTWERSLLHRILTAHNYASALSLLPHTHTAARHVSHTRHTARHIRLRQKCAVIPYPHQSISISLVVVGAQIRANSLKKQERQQLKSSLLQLSSATVRGGRWKGRRSWSWSRSRRQRLPAQTSHEIWLIYEIRLKLCGKCSANSWDPMWSYCICIGSDNIDLFAYTINHVNTVV